jgi:hypothetical protein
MERLEQLALLESSPLLEDAVAIKSLSLVLRISGLAAHGFFSFSSRMRLSASAARW